MGPSQSSPKPDEQQETFKVSHPRFVRPKFIRDKDEDECIEIQLPVANEK